MNPAHFFAAGILSVFLFSHAAANAATQSGRVMFRGEILNAPCQMHVNEQNLTSTCLRASPSKHDILSITQAGSRTYSSRAGKLSFMWTNRSERAGVLTVAVP